MPKLSRRSKIIIWVAVALLIILLVGPRLLGLYTDWLWFKDMHFQSVFTKIIWTRIWLFVIAAVVAGAIVFASLFCAYRWRSVFVPASGPADPVARYRAVVTGHLRWFTWGPVVVVGIISGLVAQGNWATVQKFFHGENFGIKDPQFNLDVGFYAWDLPFYRFILNFFFVLAVVAFLFALLTHYVFGGIRLAGRGGSLTKAARIQLATTAGIFLILKAFAYWLDRYTLLSSTRKQSIFTGAGYTDINAVLPAKLILMAIAIICAVAFFAGIVLRDLRVPALATALMLLSALVIGVGWPLALEQFSVKPNAAAKEAKFIGRNIDATKQAYGITDSTVTTIPDWGAKPADPSIVDADNATLSNIRILDPNVLSDAFTQLEQSENFYGFPNQLSLDRYMDDGAKRDFVVAVRELDPSKLTANQQNWINKHTVYTHGDGFIAAPANQVDQSSRGGDATTNLGGRPNFVVSDLHTINTPAYKNSPIQVTQPRVYFGEMIAKVNPDYAIVGGPSGQPKEFDNSGQNYTYQGGTGVPLNNWFNRFAYAVKYTERNFLLSGAINKDSKLLYNRDPRDRVKKAAPWLTVDSKTYPAVINGKIEWIVDGYTTLDQYPYAQKMSLQDATTDAQELTQGQTGRTQTNRQVSYVRNSVKATVDAYTGKVTLYQFDDKDPVLKTWMKVFPDTVQPRSVLDKPENADLRAHMRYPEDLFKIQRALLAKYHVSDPQMFFRGNDFWSVPADPTQDQAAGAGLDQPPYYYLAANPGNGQPSFQLSTVMNALRREFMAAHISVDSDPQNYGHITIRTVSSQTDGPKQSFAQMTTPSDPSFSVVNDRKALENTGKVIWGNLLTLPVGKEGILNVLPMYAQANGDATYPQLYRVLMRYNASGGANKWTLGYAATVAEALKQVGINPTTPLPGQNTPAPQGNNNQPTPQPQPQPQPPANPAPGSGAGVAASPQLTAVIGRINSALDALQQAQANGDYTGMAKAQADLKAATGDYEQLVTK